MKITLFRFSRSTLLTMLGIAATTLFTVWVITQSQVSARYPDAPAKHVKQLRFEDRPDGSIAVFDYQTGKQIPDAVIVLIVFELEPLLSLSSSSVV